MNKAIFIIVSSLFLCFSSAYADLERMSVSSTGEQANHDSGVGYLSADGRYVLFYSEANNLVPQDTNDWGDIFVRDRQTGLIQRVSVSSTGEQANSVSGSMGLSADGRYALFYSYASNLVPLDTNDEQDVFVHDQQTGITERVSVSSTGMQANDNSFVASLSADGRYVAFASHASNLVPEDTNNRFDTFVHDRQSGITERVSVSSTGMQANNDSFQTSISADGRYVGFRSFASNLVQLDTNSSDDIFVHDRFSGLTERVNVSSNGLQANAGSGTFSISKDGRIVAFASHASNLVPEDTNSSTDIFVRDRKTGMTERISVSSLDEQIENFVGSTFFGGLSNDGRYVSFLSHAANLVPGDTNNSRDVFVRDRQTRLTERVNVSSTGMQANTYSDGGILSADGRYVVFYSAASNLVSGDNNNATDIFITENPLINEEKLIVEKLINKKLRKSQSTSAQLSTGTQYKQFYKVTNSTTNRVYQVRVLEGGNIVCNLYALNPGESKQGCFSFQTVLEGDQHTKVIVTANVSGTSELVTDSADSYYKGFSNVAGQLELTYTVNNENADSANHATELASQPASFQFKIENIGKIELYGVKAYHDPVTPANSGWDQQCIIGTLMPGQVRYCRRDITLGESGLNQAMGRVQGRNAISSATDVVNASNPTYFIVP